MKYWRWVAALLACLVTATLVSFPHLGPASKSGPPLDLSSGESPARVQFARMLAAFNSGDRGVIDGYRARDVSPYWTHAPTTDMALDWFKKTGGYLLLKVDEVTPNYLVALLRSVDSDELFLMGVEVERDQPHRLIYLTLHYASKAPDEFWPKPLEHEGLVVELRRQLERRLQQGKFSGAILVRQGDQVLFREAFGFADREAGVRNSPETRFRVGQLSNMFTAVALLRLAQEGRLEVDDPLSRWLPELADEGVGRVRIAHLLSNSAGTDDLEHLGWNSDPGRVRSLDELVEEFGDARVYGRPGQSFRYSSLGYVLLAAVVERASGARYANYVRDVVFRPAGMIATDFSSEARGAGRALPYRRPAGTAEWTRMPALLCCRGAPSGDAYSTVDDLARFLVALDQRRLLDDTHTRLLLQQRTYMWGRAFAAYGLAVEIHGDGSPWLSHEDGIEGQNSGFMFRPETGHLVVVLANYDAPSAVQLVRFVGNRFPPPARPFEMNIAQQ